MKRNLRDGIPMRGDLTILVRDARTREVKKRIEIRNKITFLAADVLVELWAQRATGDLAPDANKIHSMRVGLSSTAASRSDTNLGAYVIGKALADVNKITGVQGNLQLTMTLESGDANGQNLQEAGLFTRGVGLIGTAMSDAPDGTNKIRMIARQVYPIIPKTSAITVEYSWQLAFTA